MTALSLLIARVALTMVLLPAAAVKMGRVDATAATIRRWKFVPPTAVRIVASLVAWTELSVLLAVSSGIALRLGALLAAALFASIAVAAASVVWRGINANCGCFKPSRVERVNRVTVVRACLLAAVAGGMAYSSDWSIWPNPAWSAALAVLTLPIWIVFLRRRLALACRPAPLASEEA